MYKVQSIGREKYWQIVHHSFPIQTLSKHWNTYSIFHSFFPANTSCYAILFDVDRAVGDTNDQKPVIMGKNVMHREEIQQMIAEMKEKKPKEMIKKKTDKEEVKISLVKSRQQTASTSTTPTTAATNHADVTTAVSTTIGVLVIACDRPTVARALDLLLKLVIICSCRCSSLLCFNEYL